MASEIIIYKTEKGKTEIDVRLENEDVWLNQQQLAILYQTTKQNISLHLVNIYKEGELTEDLTVKEYLTVQQEGSRSVNRPVKYYNLDAIISVGYRVKSNIATQFRIWATSRLKEFLIKGFILDDARLKEAKNDYFNELIERVRDTYAQVKRYSTERFARYTQQASIMMQTLKRPETFFQVFRINFTGLYTPT
jgi:hypothetical protein